MQQQNFYKIDVYVCSRFTKPMQQLFFSLSFLILFFTVKAQDAADRNAIATISGKIIDSATGKPLEYATLSLFKSKSDKPVNGTVTNKEGKYTLAVYDTGRYRLTVEFLAHKPQTVNNITINKKNQPITLADILMTRDAVTMQGVTVAAAGLIENKIDKLVFNAEKDITSQGAVATDVLKKVPQVSVDVDGNVELAGSSGVRFLINGKPSAAFGSNVAEVLQSIPASQIKSIEVITNPGAKYDAQGKGGIINIILKQNRVRGVNGNISVTAGTLNETASLNFNARKNNFGINLFTGANMRLATSPSNNYSRTSIDTAGKRQLSLTQDGSSRFKRHGNESGIGFDWTYKKKNNFTGSLRYGGFGNSGKGYSNQQQLTKTQSGGIISSVAVVNNAAANSSFYTTDANINYKRTFNKEDQELEISYNSTFENNKGYTENNQQQAPAGTLLYGIYSHNPGTQREKELQVDYTQPLKEDIIWGLGGKINRTTVNSNAETYSYKQATNVYQPDTALSNFLNYKQDVYALYTEIGFAAGKLFDTKLGGRYERTEINSFYSNAQQQAGKNGYNTFVPSVFFSKKISSNETLKLSYSKRIERPDYGDLNPFINTADPKNISSGNPYLKPEVSNRVELSYNRNFENAGFFMLTAFYRNNQQDIQPFLVFYPQLKVGDSVYTNVTVSTRQNIGTENNMGITGFTDIHINTKLTLRSNISFFKRHTLNAIDPDYNSHSFNYRFNINSSYQFNSSFSGEFFGSFSSARNEAQGKYPSFTTYSIAMRKQLWNKKGSLALIANNFLNNYITQKTILYGPNFSSYNIRKIPYRSVSINFTWKFGKLEFKKEKEELKDATLPQGI